MKLLNSQDRTRSEEVIDLVTMPARGSEESVRMAQHRRPAGGTDRTHEAPQPPPCWEDLFAVLCDNGGVPRQTLAFVRGSGGKAIVLPNNDPRVARSSLQDYRAHAGHKERLVADALGRLFRSSSVVQTAVPTVRSQFPSTSYGRTLRPLWSAFEDALDMTLATFSTVLRPPGTDWTPIVHLFDEQGERVAVAKIGFSARARRSVRREAKALNAFRDQPLPWITPRCLGVIEHEHVTAVLMSPLPLDLASIDRQIDIDLLEDVASLRVTDDDECHREHLSETCTELGLAPENGLDDEIFADLPRARCHGDLVPWNIGHSAGRLVIWDWEYSFRDAPLGFDAIQSRYRAYRERGCPAAKALHLASSDAQETLALLGLDRRERNGLYVIHGIDAATRLMAGVDVPGSGIQEARQVLSMSLSMWAEPSNRWKADRV